MIVEMRTYKTKPGKHAEFLNIFRTKSIRVHIEIGMKILGPFLSIDDSDTFFFMRGFPDLASRESMRAKLYECDLWKQELDRVLMPMEGYEVVLVDDRTTSSLGKRRHGLLEPGPSDISDGLGVCRSVGLKSSGLPRLQFEFAIAH
jgi:NIPSNAP